MQVSFTGTRKYSLNGDNIDKLKMVAYTMMGRQDINILCFGGAEGVDTDMLCYCGRLKNHLLPRTLKVILPDTIEQVTEFARDSIEKYADEVIELGNKITRDDGYNSYRLRNTELVLDADILWAFPKKGNYPRSGTWMTVNIAKNFNKSSKHQIAINIRELERL